MMHEKLVCYRQLVEVAEELAKRIEQWPRGYGYLSDQIQRAISSAILTLAEGNGKEAGLKDRKRFFQMSMGSIAEVKAALDLARIFRLLASPDCQRLQEVLRASYFRIRRLP